MTDRWSGPVPPRAPTGAGGALRAAVRGLPLALLLTAGLAVFLLVRIVEAPRRRQRRPVTPWITQGVCRAALVLLGLRLDVSGRAAEGRGALVSNHASWLDIFALNACQRVCFVAKAEVRGWPGIGLLARATGTVFIRRARGEAAGQTALLRERIAAGDRLALFPEGTSTDGHRVLRFKPTLLAALAPTDSLQPVSLIYTAPSGADPRALAWYGEMELAPHLFWVLARRGRGAVAVIRHPQLRVDAFAGRKELAAAAEAAVRAPVAAAVGPVAGGGAADQASASPNADSAASGSPARQTSSPSAKKSATSA